jgi:hypothetical protein
LRVDHFATRGPELIDFDFAVQDKELAGFEPAFEVTAVKKLDGERAGFVLNEQMIDSIAAAHAADGLAAHDFSANGVDTVWLNVFEAGETDAVFVAKWQIGEQIFECMDSALGEEFGSLRANAFDHADFRSESYRHAIFVSGFVSTNPILLYIIWRTEVLARAILAGGQCVSLE